MRLHIAILPLTSANYKQVTVLYPEVDTLPIVQIKSPNDGAEYKLGTTIMIEAEAIDGDGVIDSVEFFVNDSKIGTDATSPYSIEWKPKSKGEYSIKARATDDSLNTSVSSVVGVTIKDTITSITNQFVELKAEVYPNPTDDILYIRCSIDESGNFGTVNIYNMLGENMISREVKQDNTMNTHKIDISELKNGLYIIDIQFEDKRYMTKVVKN
jgi:hypothetical protein